VRVAKRVTDEFFVAGRVAGRHYPCPNRPVVIPNCYVSSIVDK